LRTGSAHVQNHHQSIRRFRPPRWLEDLSRDLRHSLRTLCNGRGYSLAAAATLALAIGASTAMFSVLDTVLLEPLPYRAANRLAMLWSQDVTRNLLEARSALADVEQWRDQSRTFEDLATFDAVSMTLTDADGAEQIVGARISRNLLSVLGVEPVRGRGFSTDEPRQGTVLIGHRFWLQRFAGSDDVVGATIVVNGLPSEIIGVLPVGFETATVDADVWQPNAMGQVAEAGQDERGGATWFVVGRLRSTATFEDARTEMRVLADRLSASSPAGESNRSIAAVPLSEYVVAPQSRLALWMLGGAVCFVFLIAAANVASLSLARSVAHAREMAVRAMLGASNARIVRQVLTESVLLAVISGSIGTLLAAASIRLIRAFGPDDLPRLDEAALDAHALGWALGVSLVAGILVGLAPAMTTLRRELTPAWDAGVRGVSGGRFNNRIRRTLVVAEFAIAMVLLVGAGLLVRSWAQISRVDPGFVAEGVLAMRIAAPTVFDDPGQRRTLYDRVLERIEALPGVENAGMIGDLWIANDREQFVTVEREDVTIAERLRFRRDEVSPDFFQAVGTRLLHGRFFAGGDRPQAPLVAIINEAMARRSWPDQDPIGRRFKLGPRDSERPWYTVVGVVANMRRQGLEREPAPQMFESLAQNPPRSVELFVRTASADPLTMAATFREAVHSVERNAPIFAVTTLEQQLGDSLAQRRFQTSLLTGFSVIALLLAGIGVYGLIQYSIATRTHEIGLRMAVGARARDIFRLVLGEGLSLCLIGLALGLVGAWWLGHEMPSLLFGVSASDPWTFATVSLSLTGVAMAACYFPARRAMTLDPAVTLRRS
jgi:putative ABC transport system permease protein